MAEPLALLKTEKAPTLFNDAAAAGAVIGTVALPIPLLGTAVGGLIGGGYGKQRMEEHLVHGKKLRAPSPFNLRIFTGMLKGAAVGLSVVAIGALTGFGIIALLGVAVTAVGAVVGGMQGSTEGKQIMATELAEAQKQQSEREAHENARPLPERSRPKMPEIDYGPGHPAYEAERRGYSHTAALERSSRDRQPVVTKG
jgi:hypothetical protein